MGPAGAGSLAQVINAAIANKTRFDTMKAFFGDVGSGDKAGVWEGVPAEHPGFREQTRKKIIRLQKKLEQEAMGS
jgi:chlorophyllide a reductase subunit Y